MNAFIAELVIESVPSSKPYALAETKETNSVVVDTLIKEQINTELAKKTTKIHILLRVENNSKFVRRKKKVKGYIERSLSWYKAEKITDGGGEYIITLTYENDEDLDKQVYSICQEMASIADMDDCFIELDVNEIGTDRYWY